MTVDTARTEYLVDVLARRGSPVMTVDTVRTEYLVDVLARRGSPVMLIGHHGSAKSLIVQRYLSKTSSDDGHLSKTDEQ